MNDVAGEDQRDLVRRLLDGHLLQFAAAGHADAVEQAGDLAAGDIGLHLRLVLRLNRRRVDLRSVKARRIAVDR